MNRLYLGLVGVGLLAGNTGCWHTCGNRSRFLDRPGCGEAPSASRAVAAPPQRQTVPVAARPSDGCGVAASPIYMTPTSGTGFPAATLPTYGGTGYGLPTYGGPSYGMPGYGMPTYGGPAVPYFGTPIPAPSGGNLLPPPNEDERIPPQFVPARPTPTGPTGRLPLNLPPIAPVGFPR